MSVSNDYLRYVLDQLGGLGATARRMFGGYGLYAEGFFFGIIDDAVYFKVDDSNRQDYESLGSRPFSIEMGKVRRRVVSLSYFQVPEEVLEDADEAKRWARKALAVAVTAAAARPASRPAASSKKRPARAGPSRTPGKASAKGGRQEKKARTRPAAARRSKPTGLR